MFSWHTHKISLGQSKIHGRGNFAIEKIDKDEIIMIFGGYVMSRKVERNLPPDINDNGIFVTPEFVIGVKKLDEVEKATYVNHSCDPNCGIKGQIFLVAMRDIEIGEEITFDYAMALHRLAELPQYKFSCTCGSTTCRNYVTDEDWKIPELRRKYAGYFQYYLEELIRGGND